MLTIVFYGTDDAAAKRRAKEIAAHKPAQVRVYDSMVWNGEQDVCDAVEILPCVSEWRRYLIERVFPGKIADGQQLAECKMFKVVAPITTFTEGSGGGGHSTLPTTKRPRGRPRKVA